MLLSDGFPAGLLADLRKSAKAEKAVLVVVAPKVGGALDSEGNLVEADFPLSSAPSIFFDTVVVLLSEAGAKDLATQAAAVGWVSDAFAHLKVIAHTPGSQPLLDQAGVKKDEGLIPLAEGKPVRHFITAAKSGRIWKREPTLRRPG